MSYLLVKNKSTKGFTLIELLIVIAIIGILASVILVGLNSAKDKSKDAAIIASVNSMMKAAQVGAVDSRNYSSWFTGWIGDVSNCDSPSFASVADPVSAREACKEIIRKIGPYYSGGTMTSWKLFIGDAGGSSLYPKMSIMAVLPGKQRLFCVGSNGKSSSITSLASSAGGCSGGAWACPGCRWDTSGGD